jgi:hypothetical protein
LSGVDRFVKILNIDTVGIVVILTKSRKKSGKNIIAKRNNLEKEIILL